MIGFQSKYIHPYKNYKNLYHELEICWCLTAEEELDSGCSYPDVALHSIPVLT
jgi:hypothetical protein